MVSLTLKMFLVLNLVLNWSKYQVEYFKDIITYSNCPNNHGVFSNHVAVSFLRNYSTFNGPNCFVKRCASKLKLGESLGSYLINYVSKSQKTMLHVYFSGYMIIRDCRVSNRYQGGLQTFPKFTKVKF